MDTISVAQSAKLLGTSAPRVQRAIDHHRIRPVINRRGHQELTEHHLTQLKSILGVTPQSPLSREALRALAALNQHPAGLRTARAVARAANISPTTATKALAQLAADGYITANPRRLLEGRPLTAVIFEINYTSRRWADIAEIVRQVHLPHRQATHQPTQVPRRLWHHFWNADPTKIRLPADAAYVAARLLRSDDPQAVSWAATNLAPTAIVAAATLRGVTPAARRMINNLAAPQ